MFQTPSDTDELRLWAFLSGALSSLGDIDRPATAESTFVSSADMAQTRGKMRQREGDRREEDSDREHCQCRQGRSVLHETVEE